MTYLSWLILSIAGLISGVLAGFLGIGGGTMLVPFLVAIGYQPIQAVATSSLAILITSISGSIQNWRMGHFDFKRVFALGLPAVLTSQIGVFLAKVIPDYILVLSFGLLLIINIYLVDLRQRMTAKKSLKNQQKFNSMFARLCTGSSAGILAGLFGVGGGVIMVPLQMLLLEEPIKIAIQTSLGVVVITAISACIGHAFNGNVLFIDGMILGIGGLIGAQISTRILPKLPDKLISLAFRSLLGILATYMFWKAWQSYNS
ncbi:MAG TPA: permease [Cyanobacteria bacterium UBA11149]|nr:permease [Cyanobacteria bacterium UBA11367]HBE58432.1 permease [Cyanobacteria bacterium UBA11366]HBK63746.1 permease [Cyanobacteria bacterium UBA11166]HBR74097.1 permease [Cyanobacteria bacterium UBA11159]HBS70080.1 permease [Cyanobacteria bacterium UBA11153]HBW90457.1 permease [Cyanobacteria bacterium UBA11149]HCA94473.1 permease [Cyanobacteria bacterium UBA9226]